MIWLKIQGYTQKIIFLSTGKVAIKMISPKVKKYFLISRKAIFEKIYKENILVQGTCEMVPRTPSWNRILA